MNASELEMDIVNRKLTGVFTTFKYDIPWDMYEKFIDDVMAYLEDEDVKLSRAEVMANPAIHDWFYRELNTTVSAYVAEEVVDNVEFEMDIVEQVFHKEIEEQRAIYEAEYQKAKEEHYARMAEEAERQRQAVAEKIASWNKAQAAIKTPEVQLTLGGKHANKISKILKFLGFAK